MSDLLNILADEFPEIARARDRYRRQADMIAAATSADTIVDTARALITSHDDGSRTVHHAAALVVPELLTEIDRLTAQLNTVPARDERNDERARRTMRHCVLCASGDHHPSVHEPLPDDEAVRRRAENPRPARGDQFATWLKAQRDEYDRTSSPQWHALDGALDEYRLHADTGTPLNQHTCEGRCDDCASGGTR